MEKKPRIVKGFSVTRELAEDQTIHTVVFFTLQERKQTVICDMHVEIMDGTKSFKTKAVCQQGDVFSIEEGMQIALEKAQLKFKAHMARVLNDVKKQVSTVEKTVDEMTNIRHAQMIRNKKYRLRP